MSDLVRWDLRGPVRTLRTHFAEWNDEARDWRPLKVRLVATFRPDGNLSEIEHHNADGSVSREVHVYDEAGRLLEDQWWSNGVLTSRVVHTYDIGGRPASTVTHDVDGTKRESELCRYDEHGRRTKVVFLPVQEASDLSCSSGSCGTMYMYGVEGSEATYSAPGATTLTTTYDEFERSSEVAFHDANDALVSRVLFSRDKDGRVLSERMEFAAPAGLFAQAINAETSDEKRASLLQLVKTAFEDETFSLATFAYDEKGRRIERIRLMGKLSEERVTVRYDDFDNPVEEVRRDVRREMRIDDGAVKIEERPSQVQHLRFDYQYDAYGNWTERIAWHRMEPNTDARPGGVDRRTITYYTN